MPKVSVIVPNFQHEAYLQKRLDSIARQTFQDFELILLDDGSKDASVEILRKFADRHPDVKLLLNEKNSGSPFIQWNKGIAQASGEYLWIAESDDYCEDTFLESLVPLLDQNPELGIAYAHSMMVDEQDQKIHSYAENLAFIYKSKAWESDFIKSGKEACKDWLLYHNPIPNASGILIRRKAYEEVKGADPKFRLNGDWHLYAKILLKYDLGFLNKELNYFRVHRKTQRSKSRKRASVYEELYAINKLLRAGLNDAQSEADAALSEFGNWWIGNLPYHSWTRENWRINRKMYRVFRELKSPLAWRIFLTFIISYFRDFLNFIGLLKPLKKLRSALWPGKYWDK